jgi:hypothetical protein
LLDCALTRHHPLYPVTQGFEAMMKKLQQEREERERHQKRMEALTASADLRTSAAAGAHKASPEPHVAAEGTGGGSPYAPKSTVPVSCP